MKHPEQANLWRQNEICGCLGLDLGGMGECPGPVGAGLGVGGFGKGNINTIKLLVLMVTRLC